MSKAADGEIPLQGKGSMGRTLLIQQDFLLSTAEVVSLSMELNLLLHSMTNSITLTSPQKLTMNLKLGAPEKWTIVENLAPSSVSFLLSRNEAEYIQAVLLRAYRDKVAEVDHIHIEGRTVQDHGFDLTLMFQTYMPPMSPQEAAKLMND
jgi:hypothetical protein